MNSQLTVGRYPPHPLHPSVLSLSKMDYRGAGLVSDSNKRLTANIKEQKKALKCAQNQKFLELPFIYAAEAKSLEDKFLHKWKNQIFNGTQMECKYKTIVLLSEQILNRCIEEQSAENLFLEERSREKVNFSRTAEIIKILQNELLALSPISKRIKVCKNLLIYYSIENKSKTLFFNFLYNFLEKLILLTKSKNLNNLVLVDKSENLNEFIETISQIKNNTHYPDSLHYNSSNMTELNKKLSKILVKFFNDEKKESKKVFSFIAEWNDTSKKVNQLTPVIIDKVERVLLSYFIKMDFIWNEPVMHELKEILYSPIDQITPRDMLGHYIRCLEFSINGKMFDISEVTDLGNSGCFIFKLLCELYRELGFFIDNNSLYGQVGKLLKIKKWDEAEFPKETQQCFRLLKMGCVNVGLRSLEYLRCRLDGIKEGPLKLSSDKVLGLNFHIDPNNHKNTYVEHKRSFKIYTKNEPTQAILETSWKVFWPSAFFWPCLLKVSDIKFAKNAEIGLVKLIQYHATTLKEDVYVEEKIGNGTIVISHQLREN